MAKTVSRLRVELIKLPDRSYSAWLMKGETPLLSAQGTTREDALSRLKSAAVEKGYKTRARRK